MPHARLGSSPHPLVQFLLSNIYRCLHIVIISLMIKKKNWSLPYGTLFLENFFFKFHGESNRFVMLLIIMFTQSGRSFLGVNVILSEPVNLTSLNPNTGCIYNIDNCISSSPFPLVLFIMFRTYFAHSTLSMPLSHIVWALPMGVSQQKLPPCIRVTLSVHPTRALRSRPIVWQCRT